MGMMSQSIVPSPGVALVALLAASPAALAQRCGALLRNMNWDGYASNFMSRACGHIEQFGCRLAK